MENKNNVTELVFILDRSGSMSGLEKDTIGGFNSMIEKQRKQEGECYVSTVLFDHVSEVLHDRIKLSEVSLMTEKEYQVRGSTALIDALGGAIHHIGNIHKYARNEDVPEHTIFVITTDGMENASHIYSADRVREMVNRQKERYGWEFIFIGANIDDLADHQLGFVVEADQLALQCHGEFVDQRGIYKFAFCGMESGFFHFVRCFVAGYNAYVIGLHHMSGVGDADSKGFACQYVFRGFVFAGKVQGDSVRVCHTAPGGIHGVGNALFVIRGDN